MNGTMWTFYVGVTAIVFVGALLALTDPYRRSLSEYAPYRRRSATAALLAPLWPIVAVLAVVVGIPYGFYRLVRIALGKEKN